MFTFSAFLGSPSDYVHQTRLLQINRVGRDLVGHLVQSPAQAGDPTPFLTNLFPQLLKESYSTALADALATSTLPFQSAKYLMETWPFGELLCKVVLSIDYYNMFTSIFTLTMMSVDRYIAVCHPVKALDFRTPAKAKLINVCIWVLSSVIGVPIMVMADLDCGITICLLQFPEPQIYWDTVTKICVFIFAFLVPILVITICYGLMILRLKNVRLLSGSKEKDRNLRRITRMVLIVVAAFIICWTPIQIFVIVWTLVGIDKKNPYVMASLHFCIALGYTNSSLNPILYAFLDENFKRCFREFCLPFRSRMEQNSFSRARNSTQERGQNPLSQLRWFHGSIPK
uniref:Opioid receptor delta 1 n=1 Tax=Laticauda laticaudata TaxID=8630 RepID=A0A8C5SQW4_LATLA